MVKALLKGLFVSLFLFMCHGLYAVAPSYISHSRLMEGVGNSLAYAVKDGELHIVSRINDPGAPVTNGSAYKGNGDLYYQRYDAETHELLTAAYIGGSGDENMQTIQDVPTLIVEGDDVYFLAGSTSADYPVTNGSARIIPEGENEEDWAWASNIVLTRLNKHTGNITMATYLGFQGVSYSSLRVSGGEAYAIVMKSLNDIPVTPGGLPFSGTESLNALYLRVSTNTGEVLTASYFSDNVYSDLPHMVVSGNKVYALTGYRPLSYLLARYDVLDKNTGASLASATFAPTTPAGTISVTRQNFYVRDGRAYIVGNKTGLGYPVNTVSVPETASNIYYTVLNANTGAIVLSRLYEQSSGFRVVQDDAGHLYIASVQAAGLPTTDGSGIPAGGFTAVYLRKINMNTGMPVVAKYIQGSYLTGAGLQIRAIAYDCREIHILPYFSGTQDAFPVTDASASQPFTTGRLAYLRYSTSQLQQTYGTYVGGWTGANSLFTLHAGNRTANLIGFTTGGLSYPKTPASSGVATTIPTAWTQYRVADEEQFTDEDDVLTPSLQEACAFGSVRTIHGTDILIPSDSLPLIYRSNVPYEQEEIKANYQWQSADAPAGPWTNIGGGILKDYTPLPLASTKYFRRVSYIEYCGTADTISVSSVAAIEVSTSIAPIVSGGVAQNTCPLSPVTIGGAPTASGGAAPYTYRWYLGSDTTTVISTLANPEVSPANSAVYAVFVTDDNGCTAIGQSQVFVYRADAGPDLSTCGTDSVRIQSKAIPGLPGVTYSWSPAAGLSCTTCFSPMALPAAETNYIYTVTVPKATGTCAVSDTVNVFVVPAPAPGFAGPDAVACYQSGNIPLGTPRAVFPVSVKSVTQSTTATAGTVANLTDNNFGTGARTDQATQQWVQFDLGSEIAISRVELAALSNVAELNGAVIQYSTNGTSWTSYSNISGTSVSALTSFTNVNFPVARYIRIFRSANQRVALSEIKVEATYTYTWSPSNFLSPNNQPSTQYYHEPALPLVENPRVYTLTASSGNCVFRDTVQVEVISAHAGNDGCGPRMIGRTTNDDPRIGETFHWEVVSGSGTITGAANTPTTTVSASLPGQPTVYRLTTSYKGVDCTDEVVVPDCGCLVVLDADSDIGCPGAGASYIRLFPATTIGLGDSMIYSWTPTVGLSAYNTREVFTTDNAERTYTLTVTSFWDASVTCYDTIRVNHPAWSAPVFNAEDKYICSGSSVQIGDITVPGYVYEWSPATGLSNDGVSDPVASPGNTTAYHVKVTESATGCFKTDTVTVHVRNVTAEAGPDLQVCLDGIVQIGGRAAQPGYSYSWYPDAQWQNGTDSSFARPEVLAAANLTFVLEVRDSLTGCVDTDTMHIEVLSAAALVAAPDVNICPGGSALIGSAAEPGVTYSWSPATGLSDPNIARPAASPGTTTEYIVTASFPGTCDDVTDTVLVSVFDPSFTLPDINYCPSDLSPLTLGGAYVPTTGLRSWGPYQWTSLTPTNILSGNQTANPTVTNPKPATPVDVYLTVYYENGCIGRDTMKLIPTGIQPEAGANKTICLGGNTQIGSSLNTTGAGITYAWTPAAGLSCTDCPEPVFTPSAIGTYNFTLSRTEDGCTRTDVVTVTVVNVALPVMSSPTVCQNSCVQIGAPAQPGVTYAWTPATGLSATNISNPVACAGTTGISYTLTAVSAQGCVAQQTIAVNVTSSALPQINMPDTVMVPGIPVNVQFNPEMTPAGDYSYLWTPNDLSLSNRYVLNPVATVTSTPKVYTLTATDLTTGCEVSKNVMVLQEPIILPVELTHFDAALIGDIVLLDWATASERNNDHFVIERSVDGISWEEIGREYGYGTTSVPHSYRFTDEHPLYGVSYYRLKQVDFDGKYDYSPVRSVEYIKSSAPVRILWYPNPSRGEIRWAAAHTEGILTIAIMDILGRQVFSTDASNLSGNTLNVGHIIPGTYFISFVKETGIQTDKLIIQQ